MADRKKPRVLHPSLAPQRLPRQPDAWYYEDLKGITLIVHAGTETKSVRISWWRLLKSATRCGWTVRHV